MATINATDRVGADSGAGRVETRAWAALVVLCLGAFLVVLDTTIVNIAVPSIMSGLQSGLDQVLWVLNGYMLVYAALLITGGRLGDFYGPRRLLILGIMIFVAGSLACAVSQSVAQLIAARVVQGVGGALLTPQTLAFIPMIFPEGRRGAAIGIWSGSAGLAAAIGPSLGGFLVTSVGWRSIFLVNVPVGVLTLVGALWLLPDHISGHRHRLDLGGIGLASAGLFAIVFGVVEGERFAWGTIFGPVTIPAILLTGVAFLVAFVVWETRQPEPLMPLALFASRNFAIAASVIAVFQFVMLTFIVVMALYLQSVLRMTPLDAGLALVPMPLTVMLVGPVAGRLADRVDPRFVLMVGLLVAAGGLGLAAVVASPTATGASFVLPLVVMGAGLGVGFALVMTMGMRGAGRLAGAAAGVLNTCRQVGGVMGAAAAVAVLQNRLAASLPGGTPGVSATASASGFVGALQWTLAAPIALLVVAALSCLWIKGRSTGATIRHPAREA
ncbi:MAG: DHA2 family efflux MFS transporter permease subunit [Chloroflexota bacterium]|nr:DHA2 family efflux MFS transporter permease subunit [Chloroflexota bacterium]